VGVLLVLQSMTDWRKAYAYLNVDDPLVAWLVYRAEMVSAGELHASALSFWSARMLRGRKQYTQELMLDQVRQSSHAAAVSRLKGFYLFPNEASARAAATRWDGGAFHSEFLAEVAINPCSRISQYDAEWITQDLPASDAWMHAYFSGQATATPVWELVVEGRALILGTNLRERAYATVKNTWPQSLAVLELARLAVEVGSDLGAITAMLFDRGGQLVVDYVVRFDNDNQEFITGMKNFSGAVNTQDLYTGEKLVVPDLQNRRFVID
jgi:hypothetical protein